MGVNLMSGYRSRLEQHPRIEVGQCFGNCGLNLLFSV